jgi:hypothetical protein
MVQEVGWDAMAYIPSIMKIGSWIQKFYGGSTDTQIWFYRSFIFQNKESMQKNVYWNMCVCAHTAQLPLVTLSLVHEVIPLLCEATSVKYCILNSMKGKEITRLYSIVAVIVRKLNGVGLEV